MPSRSAVLVAIAGALALAAPAQAQAPVTLRIVFPDGFSVRQMADRVAEVRKIAIRKRGVTPTLSGGGYRAAVGRARAPPAFRPFLKRRSLEGFLFPSLYEFTQHTRAADLVANQISAFRVALARDPSPPPAREQSQRLRRPDDCLDDRARDSGRVRAAARLGRDLQPPEGGDAARDRRHSPLRPRHPRDPPAYACAPPQPKPLQHPPVQGSAPDADREPRRPLDASRRGARRAQLPLYLRRPGTVRHFFTASEEEFCAKAREWRYTEDC